MELFSRQENSLSQTIKKNVHWVVFIGLSNLWGEFGVRILHYGKKESDYTINADLDAAQAEPALSNTNQPINSLKAC